MTSCEPTRCSAYSEDLRWRIVWQTEALPYTSDQVASNLGIEPSFAQWNAAVVAVLELIPCVLSLFSPVLPRN